MGGACICPNIKNHFYSSSDFEINKKKDDQSSLNKNQLLNIENKKGNALLNIEEEKKNILFNDINNANSNENSVSSENSKNKDYNPLDLNEQINNNLINAKINNEILCKNNAPCQIINNNRGRISLINGVENVESATPKIRIGKVNLEDKAKGKKKAFSNFCQNKISEKNLKIESNNNDNF